MHTVARGKTVKKANGRKPPKGPRPLEIEHVPLGALAPAPYNPRTMTDEARARLRRGIERFGLVDPIVARRGDGLVIGGHQRLHAAKEIGLEAVPVVYLDVSDDEAAALNVLLNNPSAQGAWDMKRLSDLVSELDAHGFDATLTGFDEGELENLLAWSPGGGLPGDPDRADTTPPAAPQSVRGEVYQLGRHRVGCGDATSAVDVAALLDGACPRLMVTDPPYGVEYDPTWRNEAAKNGHIAFAPAREGDVTNDDRVDWHDAWALFGGAVVYCWHAGRHASTVQASLARAGFDVRSQIVWAKPRFVISRGHYHWQHEPCWYAVRKGGTAEWCGDRSQTTLWEIPLLDDVDQKVHGTQKPTACMERPIANHAGDVYDPFGGTGTTLIAAERQGRTAYLMEIDPRYCDVIRRRYAEYVGKPELAP